MPVSSRTSRNAAISNVSPASSLPLGNDQSCCTGRCTTTISSSPLVPAHDQSAGRLDHICLGKGARPSLLVAPLRRRLPSRLRADPRQSPPARGTRRGTRCSLTAMSDSKGDEPGERDPVEIEWQFDALDLRPVERWLATLPTLAIETGDGGTVTALARPPRRLVDSYLDTRRLAHGPRRLRRPHPAPRPPATRSR